MKISAIKQQVKQANRYSIYVDEVYAFSLSDSGLLESKLAVGDELSEVEVVGWKKRSQDDKLYAMTLRYLALRQRSSWEVSEYLKRKKADPLLSQQILNKLSDLRFLDDLAFARSWIDNRRLLKPMSRRRLVAELRAKRVPESIAEEALAEDETDELTVLKTLIAKKQTQSRYQDVTKLMQYLARQGYNYDDIKRALQEAD